MAELKNKENEVAVDDFLNGIDDEKKREDCRKISQIMQNIVNKTPKMWGDSIIGFGNRHLKYESGREIDWFEIGFSPRKASITLYLSNGEVWDEQSLANLGKYKLGKGCLYIKRLSDIDENRLENLIRQSVKNK